MKDIYLPQLLADGLFLSELDPGVLGTFQRGAGRDRRVDHASL